MPIKPDIGYVAYKQLSTPRTASAGMLNQYDQ